MALLLLLLLLVVFLPTASASALASASFHIPPLINYDCDPCLDRTASFSLVAFLPESTASNEISHAILEVAKSMNLQPPEIKTFLDDKLMTEAILELAKQVTSSSSSRDSSSMVVLMVSIPTLKVYQAVQEVLEITQPQTQPQKEEQLAIFGLDQGQHYFQANGSLQLKNFVGMDPLQAGKTVGNRLKNQNWKKDNPNTTQARRVLYLTPNKYDGGEDTTSSLSYQIQQRYQGLQDSLKRHVTNVTVTVESIDTSTPSASTSGCPYDAIVLGHPSLLDVAIQTYYTKKGCKFKPQPLATFGTADNPKIYHSIAHSQSSFTIASDYYLMASLTTTLAALYATTGTTILPPPSTTANYYTVQPRLIHVNNMQRDDFRRCEAIGFPSCHTTPTTTNDAGCPCQDRSIIRIAAVYQNNPVFELPIAASKQAAQDLGITLLLDPLDLRGTRQEKDQAYADKIVSLCQDHVDGIITSIRAEVIAEALTVCQSKRIPIIAVTPVISQANDILSAGNHKMPVILGLDDFDAGYTMGQAFLDSGITYGFCMNWKANTQTQPRCDGLEQAMGDGGGKYLGVIFGKADNKILNRDLIEKFVTPKLKKQFDDELESVSINNTSVAASIINRTNWDHVGIFLQGSSFVSGANLVQQRHPGLVLGGIEPDGEGIIYRALQDNKMVAALDHQFYIRGYLPVALLTWLRHSRQQLSNTFIPTGPIVVREPPSEGEMVCRKDYFPVCPEHQEKNHLSRGMRGVGYFILAIILAVAIGCLYWVNANLNERIVKASQPEFLVAICFGCVVMASSLIPMSLDDGILHPEGGCVGCTCKGCDAACVAVPWLFATGFAIIFSALFSKIWRMNRLISGASHFRRLKLSARDVVIPLVVLLSLNILFLVVWTILDPMHWERERRCGADEFTSYGICKLGNTNVAVVMGVLVILINLLAVLMANYQAYKARNFSTEYSESKYIALAMLCILQVSMVGIPLAFLTTDSPAAWFFIRVFVSAIITLSVLLLLFVPKIRALRERREKKRQSMERREAAARNAYLLEGAPAAGGDDIDDNQSDLAGSDISGASSSYSLSSSGGRRSVGLRIRKNIVNSLSWRPSKNRSVGGTNADWKEQSAGGSSSNNPTIGGSLQRFQIHSGATDNTHRAISSVSMEGMVSRQSNPITLEEIQESDDDVMKSDEDYQTDNGDENEGEDETEGGLWLSVSNQKMIPLNPANNSNNDDGGYEGDGLRVSATNEAAQGLFLSDPIDHESRPKGASFDNNISEEPTDMDMDT